jgi:uncharacterized membrane protein
LGGKLRVSINNNQNNMKTTQKVFRTIFYISAAFVAGVLVSIVYAISRIEGEQFTAFMTYASIAFGIGAVVAVASFIAWFSIDRARGEKFTFSSHSGSEDFKIDTGQQCPGGKYYPSK